LVLVRAGSEQPPKAARQRAGGLRHRSTVPAGDVPAEVGQARLDRRG
jgi:hypothetical protein